MSYNDPLFVQTSPPKTIFIQNYLTYFIGNQPKKTKVGVVCGPNLVQYCEKTKKTCISMFFFLNILHEVYIYKQEVVFIEIPESKLKAKLARNTIFEGN